MNTDALIAAVNNYATAHPFYFAVATGFGGFFARHFLFTAENARRVIRKWFDFQRGKLKRLGWTDAEIAEEMEAQADFFLSAAREAKAQADAAKTALPAAP